MNVSLRDQLIQYAVEQFGAEPERPWAKYPDNIILRHSNNRKWYALFMGVERKKLGLPVEGSVDILDIKCDPLLSGSLKASPGFLPGYHMNKDKWLTVLLDGTVDKDQILILLNMSYELTK